MALNKAGDGVTGAARTISCDVICSSGGWNPAIHLHSHSGGKTVFDEERGIFLPSNTLQNETCVGAAAGIFDLARCLVDGLEAGKVAAGDAGFKKSSRSKPPSAPEEDESPARLLWVVPTTQPLGRRGKHFLDQAHDVTAADIHLAAREGYEEYRRRGRAA